MFKFLAALIALAALSLTACGGNGDTANSDATPTSRGSGSEARSAAPTAAELEAFTQTEVTGYARSDSRVVSGSGSVLYTSSEKTAGGANVLVNVRLGACDPFLCGTLNPRDYASAEARRNLQSALPSAHIENPELVWEFGPVELSSGRTGLFTYALSYVETKDASGGVSRASANSFRAWYHNGGLHIMLEVFSRGGDSARSAADLTRLMSRAEAEEAAKHVFAAFAPLFDK